MDKRRSYNTHNIRSEKVWQAAIAPVIIVIVHVVINDRFGFLEGAAGRDFVADFIFHVAEKALLRGIVPAVATAGHGLAERRVAGDLTEFPAGIVAALVTVDQRFGIKRGSMVGNHMLF